ncbi:MAG: monovalent cation/H(+) antiporter subunit G [Chloroflexi bacterium]|nr:monovalent cation/H(+) antiporter subunit G [Chloroflexota bacterium]
MTDIFAGIFILIGALFLLLAGLSLIRFPDLLTRLSASTKAVAFGAGIVFVAVAVYFRDVGTDTRAVTGILFFAINAPIAATVIAKSAIRAGVPIWPGTVIDSPKYEEVIDRKDDDEAAT